MSGAVQVVLRVGESAWVVLGSVSSRLAWAVLGSAWSRFIWSLVSPWGVFVRFWWCQEFFLDRRRVAWISW